MISTVTNQGKVQFMIYSQNMNSDKFIEFLRQLIKNNEQKIFLILDNLRVHHSYIVKDWVKENQEKIQLFFLPAYSPEKNPDEYIGKIIEVCYNSVIGSKGKDTKSLFLPVFKSIRLDKTVANTLAELK